MRTHWHFFRFWICCAIACSNALADERIQLPPFEPEGVAASMRSIGLNVRYDERNHHFVAETEVKYHLVNNGKTKDDSLRWFPMEVAVGAMPGNVKVTVDEKSCESSVFGANELESSEVWWSSSSSPPTLKLDSTMNFWNANEWHEPLCNYIRQNPFLMDAARRIAEGFKQPSPSNDASIEKFRSAVTKHLRNSSLAYEMTQFAEGKRELQRIVKLIPEVDTSLRRETKHAMKGYVSLLSENESQRYSPYENEWGKKIEEWINSKPDLAELATQTRERPTENTTNPVDIDGEIRRFLETEVGHDDLVASQMASFIRSNARYLVDGSKEHRNIGSVSSYVVEYVLPEVYKRISTRASMTRQRLETFGFDFDRIDILAGTLRSLDEIDAYGSRSVDAAQRVVCFQAPLAPQQSLDISVSYSVPLKAVASDNYSLSFSTVRTEFCCVLPPSLRRNEGTVELSFPPNWVPILSATNVNWEPHAAGEQMLGKIPGIDKNLHVAIAGFSVLWGTIRGRYQQLTNISVDEVETSYKQTSNRAVQRLLLSLLRNKFQGEQSLWHVKIVEERCRTEFPEFPSRFKGEFSSSSEITEIYERLSRSPDFSQPTHSPLFNGGYRLTHLRASPRDNELLVRRVNELDETKLTSRERIGRRAMLAAFGVNRSENIESVIALTEAEPSLLSYSLPLLETCGRHDLLPFLFEHVLVDDSKSVFASKADYLLQTIREMKETKYVSNLLALAQRSTNSYRTKIVFRAMPTAPLPEYFDELVGLSEKCVADLEDEIKNYFAVLARSDPVRAGPVIVEITKKHPKTSLMAIGVLDKLRESMLSDSDRDKAIASTPDRARLKREAIEAYETETDKWRFGEISRVLIDLLEPGELSLLKYRPDFPNTMLINSIRKRGGTAADFEFVEKAYLDRMSKHQFNGDRNSIHSFVSAFAIIGDRRALPYLEEILTQVDAQFDVAKAIGFLILDKAEP